MWPHVGSVTTYPAFPELSRAFSLRQSEQTVDPTLRDSMENGIETTRARFTRQRRTFSMSVDLITAEDKAAIAGFKRDMKSGAAFGALPFLVTDPRDAENPQTYLVRFATLPKFVDAGWIVDQFRYNCTFEVREV